MRWRMISMAYTTAVSLGETRRHQYHFVYNSCMMWTFELNSDDVLAQIIPLLDKDVNSKGSFQEDYLSICEQNRIIPCPYIKSSAINSSQESIKIANGVIDLSSWRAMLLAISTVNSKVNEIYVHSCQITAQHILELSKALEKLSICTVAKFQYLYVLITPTTTPLWIDSLKSLFSDTTCLEYISLKGCRFGNEIIQPAVTALSSNYKLKSLNLSDNVLSDDVIVELIKSIKLKTNLNEVSFSKNQLSGASFSVLSSLLCGTLDAVAEDEAAVKANVKVLAEKNKSIKDNNKKRKKAGLVEIAECVASSDTIVKKEGKSYIQNRNFAVLDFSENPIESDKLTAFVTALQQHSTAVASTDAISLDAPAATEGGKVTVMLKGCGEEALSSYEGDWVRVVV